MVKGIGVDLVRLERMSDILKSRNRNRFVRKLFTREEIRRASRAESRISYFATLFAAKESILKAFGIGWVGAKGTDIEIRRGKLGAPVVKLRGNLAKLADNRGVTDVFVSLSYDSDYAVAVSVLEGDARKRR